MQLSSCGLEGKGMMHGMRWVSQEFHETLGFQFSWNIGSVYYATHTIAISISIGMSWLFVQQNRQTGTTSKQFMTKNIEGFLFSSIWSSNNPTSHLSNFIRT